MGSLIQQFTTEEGEYSIDGHLFLKRFGQMQRVARLEYLQACEANKLRKEKIMSKSRLELFPISLGR